MKSANLFDGENNGFILMYVKDKKLCHVLLKEEQKDAFNFYLKCIFNGEPARIYEEE